MPIKLDTPQQQFQMPQINPLQILQLKMQMEESQRRQEEHVQTLQQKAKEQFFAGIEMGLSPEVLRGTIQHLDANTYALGVEASKQRKKNLAAGGIEKSLPSIAQTMEPVQLPGGGLAMPPRSEAAGQAWIDAVDAGRPDLAQNINLLADAMSQKAATESGVRGAQEAKERRVSEHSYGLQRQNLVFSDQLQQQGELRRQDLQRQDMVFGDQLQQQGEVRRQQLSLEQDLVIRARESAAAGEKMTNEAVAEILASTDPRARGDLYESLYKQGYSAPQIARIVKTNQLRAQQIQVELARTRSSVSPNAGKERVYEALQRVRDNPNDQEALDILVVDNMAIQLPWTPKPGEPLAYGYVIGRADVNQKRVEGANQLVNLDDSLTSLDNQISLASQDPAAARDLRGIAGSEPVQYLKRITGSQNPVVAAIGTKLTMIQKQVAAIGNVGQITDFEQMMAKLALPLMTEMIGPDGRPSDAARARILELKSLGEMNRRSLYDPRIKAELKARVEAEMAGMTPQQRRAVNAFREAVKLEDPETIARSAASAAKLGLNLGAGGGPGAAAAEREAAELEKSLGLGAQ